MVGPRQPVAGELLRATRCAIAVMAKAPAAGRSKTRLTPPLTPEQAAALSAAFLRDITQALARAARDRPIDPWVAYAPAGLAGAFDGIIADGTELLLADGATDVPPGVTGFGRCLFHAIHALLAKGYGAACVLNSDSPTLPVRILCDAADILLAPGDRAVIGPAEDGGYYLLGVKAAHAHLFADIAWSTDRVAETTRERARQAGLDLVELPRWYDVDDAASLDRLRRDLAQSGDHAAPASAHALAGFTLAHAGTGV
jgi:rSAM/selenodomain-associated transferase 1